MIQARGLARDYGPTHALRGVTFEVRRGEAVALLGPNGAGKSTLLGILAGVLRPTSGSAEVAGLRVPEDAAALGGRVGYVPQGESVYPELTVEENLLFFGRMHGVRGDALRGAAGRLLAHVGLRDRARQRAGTLSGGLRQRLAIACSLLHDPPVLLLDEPAAGLDPPSRERLGAILRERAREGRAVLFSTHHVEDAARHADRVILLAEGAVRATAPGADAPRLGELLRATGGDA